MSRQLPHQRKEDIFLTNGYCDSIIISWQETLFTYYPNKYKVIKRQKPAKKKTWGIVFCKKRVWRPWRRIIPPELFSLNYLKRLKYSRSLITYLFSQPGEISDLPSITCAPAVSPDNLLFCASYLGDPPW